MMRFLVTVSIAILLLALVSVAGEVHEKSAPANKVSRFRQIYNINPLPEDGYSALPVQTTRQKTASVVQIASSSPGTESYVLDFISSNSKMFGISMDDLRLTKKDYDKPLQAGNEGLHYIFYEQVYRGIPVFGSSLGVIAYSRPVVLGAR